VLYSSKKMRLTTVLICAMVCLFIVSVKSQTTTSVQGSSDSPNQSGSSQQSTTNSPSVDSPESNDDTNNTNNQGTEDSTTEDSTDESLDEELASWLESPGAITFE
jgi:hypothetical protein